MATPIYDGRLVARSLRRPGRLMILLFAAAFATIILFSRHILPAELTGDPLDLHLPPPLQNTPFLHSPNPPQNAPLEPVVFSLIVFSESSAMEGAIMLKVPGHFFNFGIGVGVPLTKKTQPSPR